MIRILGNSPERVRIPDLGDVIYYKQTKDYTDEEYERSKDLKKEIKHGRIVILEKYKNIRGSGDVVNNNQDNVTINQHTTLDIETVKKAVKEALPEISKPKSTMDTIKDAIPLLIETVRKEMSSLISQEGVKSPISSDYKEPEYIPDISIDNMVSNVKAEERNVDGSDTASTLEALRRLKNKSK